MSKTRFLILILAMVTSLVLINCSKSGGSSASLAKVPITTNSKAALKEYHKGLAFSDKLQRVRALAHFREAVNKDPEFATAWLGVALVSPGLNEFMPALDSAKAHAPKASQAEQINISAVEYGLLGMNIEQGEALSQIINLYPGDERAYINLGNYLFGNQLYQAAIKAYSDAIRINDELAAPHNMLGYSQRALGNYGEAEKAFKRYIKLNAENPNAFDSYAELLLEMGRYNESIEYYQQALDLDTTFVASHLGIATNYNFLHEPEKARHELQNIRKVAANHVILRQANFAEAVSYAFEGKYVQALNFIEKNRLIAEENDDIANIANDFAQMGNMYLELDQPDVAMKKFEESIRVIEESNLQEGIKDNAYTIHFYNLARAYAAMGDFRHALREAGSYERTVRALRNPVQIGLAHQLNGIIALHQDKFQVALEQFERTNQLIPSNLYRMGLAYEGLGDMEMASNLFQRARELNILNSMDQAMVCSKLRKRDKDQNS